MKSWRLSRAGRASPAAAIAAAALLILGCRLLFDVDDRALTVDVREVALAPGDEAEVDYSGGYNTPLRVLLSIPGAGVYALRYAHGYLGVSFRYDIDVSGSNEALFSVSEGATGLVPWTKSIYFEVLQACSVVGLLRPDSYGEVSAHVTLACERVRDPVPPRDYPEERTLAVGGTLAGWFHGLSWYPNDDTDVLLMDGDDLDEGALYRVEVTFDVSGSVLSSPGAGSYATVTGTPHVYYGGGSALRTLSLFQRDGAQALRVYIHGGPGVAYTASIAQQVDAAGFEARFGEDAFEPDGGPVAGSIEVISGAGPGASVQGGRHTCVGEYGYPDVPTEDWIAFDASAAGGHSLHVRLEDAGWADASEAMHPGSVSVDLVTADGATRAASGYFNFTAPPGPPVESGDVLTWQVGGAGERCYFRIRASGENLFAYSLRVETQ